MRDIDILKTAQDLEAGLTITTADDHIRKLFEPHAPAVSDRIRALAALHEAGITTYAMIAPMLFGAERLIALLAGKIDYLLADRMNYSHADWVYRKYGLESALTDNFFKRTGEKLAAGCKKSNIDCRFVY